MTDNQRRDWIRRKGVWFWAVLVTAASVAFLWAGSQFATGQDVDWYTGFGQWLGSLIAAGVAFWIAVSDRRRRDRQHDADLAREAGLVRVVGQRLSKIQPAVLSIPQSGIRISNRRSTRIFEVSVEQFVYQGREIRLEIDSIDIHPRKRELIIQPDSLPNLHIEPDETLTIFAKGLPGCPADYVAVLYTDSSGLRWRVDSEGEVERLM